MSLDHINRMPFAFEIHGVDMRLTKYDHFLFVIHRNRFTNPSKCHYISAVNTAACTDWME